jgi:hypothetical protein
VSPSRRRDAVGHLREVIGVSERRACRVTSRDHARIISGGVAPSGNGAAPQVLPLSPR